MAGLFSRVKNIFSRPGKTLTGDQVAETVKSVIPDLKITSAIESILDNASLTADLNDDAAKELIDWAISIAKGSFGDLFDGDGVDLDELLSGRMRDIRRMMRSVNSWVAKRGDGDDDAARAAFDKLVDRVAKVYGGKTPKLSRVRRQALMSANRSASPVETISRLRAFFEGDEKSDEAA